MRKNPPRFLKDKRIRFLIVGGINTLWGIAAYPILYLILNPLGVNYLVTLVLAYAVSIAFSFTTQKYLVFRTKGKHVRELAKFLGLQCVILVLNLLGTPGTGTPLSIRGPYESSAGRAEAPASAGGGGGARSFDAPTRLPRASRVGSCWRRSPKQGLLVFFERIDAGASG